MLTSASNFNIVSMVMLTLMQRMGTEPFFVFALHFVTIASIIFEKANTDVDDKCEWAFSGQQD